MLIGIWGAGSIGCYLAGLLNKAGHQVSLLGRPGIQSQLKNGLKISDYRGQQQQFPAPEFVTNPADLPKVDMLLVTLKCTAIASSTAEIARTIDTQTPIVFMQNGLGIEQLINQHLGQHCIYSGVVGFNVVNMGNGRFHQATQGELLFESSDSPAIKQISHDFNKLGIDSHLCIDMLAVQWGKLLLNLNNSINALADIPLLEELSQKEYRQILAACQQETLQLLKAANIKPARLTAAPTTLLPHILRLPNCIFKRLAKAMLSIDPLARSSMWEDLQQGRKTEVDFLNGAVVNLAQESGLEAPINGAMLKLVHQVELGEVKQGLSAKSLKQLLGL